MEARALQPCFVLRTRNETASRDQTNSLHVEAWQTEGPWLQNDRPDVRHQAQFQDMNPINSRSTARNYLQNPTYTAGSAMGAKLGQNPYFDKFDVTSDPFNVARELRATVYEEKKDRGLEESRTLLERRFQTTRRAAPRGAGPR